MSRKVECNRAVGPLRPLRGQLPYEGSLLGCCPQKSLPFRGCGVAGTSRQNAAPQGDAGTLKLLFDRKTAIKS